MFLWIIVLVLGSPLSLLGNRWGHSVITEVGSFKKGAFFGRGLTPSRWFPFKAVSRVAVEKTKIEFPYEFPQQIIFSVTGIPAFFLS